jgi:hypothetical protein
MIMVTSLSAEEKKITHHTARKEKKIAPKKLVIKKEDKQN